MSRVRKPPPSTRRTVIEVAVASIVLGAVVGLVWWRLAPDVLVEVVENGGLALGIEEGRKLFDRDAIFACLTAGAGVLVAIVFGVRHYHRPVSTLLTLVAGGALGAMAAIGVGWLLGPSSIEARAAGAAVGDHLAVSLELDSWAVLIVWPLVAALVTVALSIFRDDRSEWSASRAGDEDRQPLSQGAQSSPSLPQ